MKQKYSAQPVFGGKFGEIEGWKPKGEREYVPLDEVRHNGWKCLPCDSEVICTAAGWCQLKCSNPECGFVYYEGLS